MPVIIDHANRKSDPQRLDPAGWYVEVAASSFFPGETVAELRIHTRIAMNRPGSDAFAPLSAVEALALSEVLREFGLRGLKDVV